MTEREKYFNSTDFKNALKKYEEACSRGDKVYLESEELTDIAEYYYKSGNDSQAVEVLDYAISLHPGAALPLVFRGRMALLDEKNPEKAKHYNELIDDQLDLDCIYLKAEIMINEGKSEDADSFLYECKERIDEDYVPDYVLDVATLFMDYNLSDKANNWLKQSYEPDLADYKELKGRIAFSKGNYEESEHIFESLLDEDPYSNHFWNSLASTQFMRNHINDAITSSEFSIAINPNDDEALLNKANGLYSLGNFDEACIYYKRFINICPKESTGYMFLGNAYLNMNRLDEAEEQYRKALEYKSADSRYLVETYQNLAFTLSQMGRETEAIDYLDKAEALPVCDKSDINVVRGHILLEHGHLNDAINSFLIALHESKFSPDIFYRISISIFDCGYMHVAYKMFKAFTDMHYGNDDEGYAYLAACCKRLGNKAEYMNNLKQACDKNPTETKIVFSEEFPKTIAPEQYYRYEEESNHNI